jgi:hypothetical protein
MPQRGRGAGICAGMSGCTDRFSPSGPPSHGVTGGLGRAQGPDRGSPRCLDPLGGEPQHLRDRGPQIVVTHLPSRDTAEHGERVDVAFQERLRAAGSPRTTRPRPSRRRRTFSIPRPADAPTITGGAETRRHRIHPLGIRPPGGAQTRQQTRTRRRTVVDPPHRAPQRRPHLHRGGIAVRSHRRKRFRRCHSRHRMRTPIRRDTRSGLPATSDELLLEPISADEFEQLWHRTDAPAKHGLIPPRNTPAPKPTDTNPVRTSPALNASCPSPTGRTDEFDASQQRVDDQVARVLGQARPDGVSTPYVLDASVLVALFPPIPRRSICCARPRAARRPCCSRRTLCTTRAWTSWSAPACVPVPFPRRPRPRRRAGQSPAPGTAGPPPACRHGGPVSPTGPYR